MCAAVTLIPLHPHGVVLNKAQGQLYLLFLQEMNAETVF
jgi:hypothetical protein